MKNFIVYDKQGKILRPGRCQDNTFYRQAKNDEFIMQGVANDVTQKIEFDDGLDIDGQPINPRVINKTPEEIEIDNPTLKYKPPPFEKQQAHITNEQWQDVRDKLVVLWANKDETGE